MTNYENYWWVEKKQVVKLKDKTNYKVNYKKQSSEGSSSAIAVDEDECVLEVCGFGDVLPGEGLLLSWVGCCFFCSCFF